jgi:hypothetical protein
MFKKYEFLILLKYKMAEWSALDRGTFNRSPPSSNNVHVTVPEKKFFL